MKAYKLFKKRKNGSIGSLYINARAELPIGEWLEAEEHHKKGFAFRPGWHTTQKPHAPHIKMDGREWWEVEIKDFYEFKRPKSQGGVWYISNKIKIIRKVQ